MNEVEAVARAIEDQLTAEDGWEVGTPALRNMCTDFAQTAIAALDAARGDQVARVVEFIREQQANADKHMREAAHRKTESHFAAAFVTLRNLADAIERGEPFNG